MKSLSDVIPAALIALAIVLAVAFAVVVFSHTSVERLERIEFGRQCHEQGVPAIANPWRSRGRWSRDWLEGWIEAAEGQE